MLCQLKIKSVNKKVFLFYINILKKICNILQLNAFCSIAILPKISKIVTVLRAPQNYKKSREQFQFILYKSIFYCKNFFFQEFFNTFVLNLPKSLKIIVRINT